jgi:S-adenosylmethionine:tRNA ribosyltransferase-isomerase
MKKEDFYYDLPKELIAQEPSLKRDEARLMVINRESGDIQHRKFKDIVDYLTENDVLVLNDTKVFPARIFMKKAQTGGNVEILLTRMLSENSWTTMVKPGRGINAGLRLIHPSNELGAKVVDVKSDGERVIEFDWDKNYSFIDILNKIGKTPLPPYIKTDPEKFKEYYQTVYAKHNGSVAAPTAGLHFTDELLNSIKEKGTKVVYITLHIGIGTFKPVTISNIDEHKMEEEYSIISKEAADTINEARIKKQGRCVAVGTTVCRTLESSVENGLIIPTQKWTDLFIKPPYKFKTVDALITNFHLPSSTLIMLVSAFYSREKILEAYELAIKMKYHFYSFGDAMFIF